MISVVRLPGRVVGWGAMAQAANPALGVAAAAELCLLALSPLGHVAVIEELSTLHHSARKGSIEQ